jgi:ABC-type multidrug transport system fused ATPase/permease subunit
MLAYTYPILSIFWTMLEFAALFIWIYLLIIVFADLFRSHDIGGWVKALWTIFIIILPLIGVLIYLIARGGKMQEHARASARQEQEAFDRYVRDTVQGGSAADEIAKLSELREKGAITDQEFEQQKQKMLG